MTASETVTNGAASASTPTAIQPQTKLTLSGKVIASQSLPFRQTSLHC